MYKDYYTLEDIMDFYVSFKTINNGQNITITPNFDKYSINKRILEGYPNSIKMPNNEEKKFLIMKNIYLFEWKFAHLMHLLNMNFIIQFIILNQEKLVKLKPTQKIISKILKNTYYIYLVFKKNGNKGASRVFIKHSEAN